MDDCRRRLFAEEMVETVSHLNEPDQQRRKCVKDDAQDDPREHRQNGVEGFHLFAPFIHGCVGSNDAAMRLMVTARRGIR
jgi:hypothetical protein